jgi:hypothetical protein
MINVVVTKQKPIIVANQESVLLTTKSITVRNNTDLSNAPRRLDQLEDVVEVSPPNGSTLVYDSNTDFYIVKPINIDAGEF